MDGGLGKMSERVPSPSIRAEAAAWLARLHAEDRDAADEAGFRAWLNTSPSHAAAFEAVGRVWSDVGGLTNLLGDADLRTDFHVGSLRERGRTSRRALLA